jgi:hypothetical protein
MAVAAGGVAEAVDAPVAAVLATDHGRAAHLPAVVALGPTIWIDRWSPAARRTPLGVAQPLLARSLTVALRTVGGTVARPRNQRHVSALE